MQGARGWGRVAALGLAIMGSPVGPARGQLAAGDIAIVAYNSDDVLGRDSFAWVALRDIPPNTPIHFTDSSVSNGVFLWSEHFGDAISTYRGPLTWTHSARLAEGTVVRCYDNQWSIGTMLGGMPRLSTSGDQLIVYSGSVASNASLAYPLCGDPSGAVMIGAISFANPGWNNVSGGSTTSSFVPPGLSTGACTAVYIDSRDDGYYTGPRSGPAEYLRSEIAKPANWVTADAAFDPTNWPAAFSLAPEAMGLLFQQF